jgi:hypothetical protein
MSKKCCPICWELFEELRLTDSNLHVQDHHCIIYQVELPGWLPASTLGNMVKRFGTHLREALREALLYDEQARQLHNVMEKKSHQKSSSLSLESSSGMSEARQTNYVLPIDKETIRNEALAQAGVQADNVRR